MNVLSKINQPISSDLTDDEIIAEIKQMAVKLGRVYSYLIYAKYEHDELLGWLIEYMISQTDEYNTLNLIEIDYQIYKTLIRNKYDENVKYVIGYRQPPEELLLTLYEPLINKLASQQLRCWAQLEYDDLCQICRYVIVKLCRQGYYIHKKLIERAFNNEVLMSIRKDKGKPTIVSLDEPQSANMGDDSEKLTVADSVADEDELHVNEDECNKIAEMLIFNEVKDIIIDLLGQRRYDQLLREYGRGYTTPLTRNLMMKVRKHLSELGITREDFNKKYHGG